jgi:hypothetical protein
VCYVAGVKTILCAVLLAAALTGPGRSQVFAVNQGACFARSPGLTVSYATPNFRIAYNSGTPAFYPGSYCPPVRTWAPSPVIYRQPAVVCYPAAVVAAPWVVPVVQITTVAWRAAPVIVPNPVFPPPEPVLQETRVRWKH